MVKKEHVFIIGIIAIFLIFLLIDFSYNTFFAVSNLELGNDLLMEQNLEPISDEIYVGGELLVLLEEGFHSDVLDDINLQTGSQIIKTYPVSPYELVLIKVSIGNELEMGGVYKEIKGVMFADLNYISTSDLVPNDPYFYPNPDSHSGQWGLQIIEMEEAWDVTIGSEEDVIAILDSGIDENYDLGTQLELGDKISPGGYDFVNDDDDPMDDTSHGTGVSSVATVNTNNERGGAGVSWNAKILPIKVMNSEFKANDVWVVPGIFHAVKTLKDQGKKCIISMSFGTYSYSAVRKSAVDYAYSQGCILVASAGNKNLPTPRYPAAYDSVIAVSSTNSNDGRSEFSNYGYHIEVAAPGEEIFVIGKYAWGTGTSYSVPHVSALASLIWSAHPEYTNDHVRYVISDSADDLGTEGWDPYFGWGRINANNALNYQFSIMSECGNNICEPTETPGNCPEDCNFFIEELCGDNVCLRPHENVDNCPQDCCRDTDGGVNLYVKGNCKSGGRGVSQDFDDQCYNGETIAEGYCSSGIEFCMMHTTKCNPLPHSGETCNNGACVFEEPISGDENTLNKCSNQKDDDLDLLVDFMDPDCSEVLEDSYGGTENNQEKCEDGVDNDGDGLVDILDPDCAAFYTKEQADNACVPIMTGTNSISDDMVIFYYCPPHGSDPCSGYTKSENTETGEENRQECALVIDSAMKDQDGNPKCTECNEECNRGEGDGKDDWVFKDEPTPEEEAVILAICGGDYEEGTRSSGNIIIPSQEYPLIEMMFQENNQESNFFLDLVDFIFG